jgi:hypothetical protein
LQDNSLQDNSSRTIRRNGIIQSYHCGNRKDKHERADEGAGVRVRVSEGEGEGEVKRVLSSSKVTSARSCLSFTDPSLRRIVRRRIVLQRIVHTANCPSTTAAKTINERIC